MKFLSSTFLVPAVGLTIVATFSTLFYVDLTRAVTSGGQEEVGTITFKQRVAQRKYSTRVVWEEVQQASPVYNYDTIRTADLSEAVVKLRDGTEIMLAENSMIMIAIAKESVSVDFNQGSIKASRGEGLSKLNIKSADSNLTLSDGDVNLFKGQGKELNVVLNKGSALLAAGGKESTIGENQRVVATDEGVQVYNLSIRLVAPAPQKYLFSAADFQNVVFTWEAVPQGFDVFLETSRDAAFAVPLVSQPAFGNAAALTLQTGSFYWRVRAVNRANRKMEYSETRRLSLIKNEPLFVIMPQDGARLSYVSVPPLVSFKWTRGENDSGYTLVMGNDPALSAPLKTMKLDEPGIAVDKLAAGAWYWRVTRKINVGGEGYADDSPVRSFVIERSEKMPAVELIYPPDGMTMNKIALDQEPVTFTWRKSGEIPEYMVTVAEDREFSDVVFTAASKANFLKMPRALGKGAYFWRVAGVSGVDSVTAPSQPRSLQVSDSNVIELVSPAAGQRIPPRENENIASASFIWKKTDVRGRFALEIARDDDFTAKYREASVDGFAAVFADLEPGDYYWRVKLIDEAGRELMKSAAPPFKVLAQLAVPVADSPKGGDTVDMSDSDSLAFKWRPIDGATVYRVALFQRKAGALQNIYEKELWALETSFTELDKLDVGEFYWTIQAFDAPGGMQNILRKSVISGYNFKITLAKMETIPKIEVPKTLYTE
ncbi:MAG: hypothetical protein EPN93_10635 [Spirochaetes bacterium]|nr:MAG: hypothetical protein EPN93_10635 [Spirochaetota bacterium]